MNLTISPIKFNKIPNFSNAQKLQKEGHEKSFCNPNFEYFNALKNQILFKGNINSKQELLEQTIKTQNLPLKPESLDFALNSPYKPINDLYIKYSKTGSKFFELFSRHLLHKNYPIKDEGELTDIIVYFIKSQNKARILNELIPSELLPQAQDKATSQIAQSNSLNVLLGAIIYENKDGFKTAFKFLNESLGEKIYPKDIELKQGEFERLAQIIEDKGLSWEDLYQETRFFNEQWHYRIHYKDIILSQIEGNKHNHEIRENCIKEAIQKIENGEVDLDSAKDNIDYTNYKIPTQKRIEELMDFCKTWGLNFKDISLLHRVFLYGEMQDGSALAHCDTYETLEYIGDAVLGFCTHEILQDNLIDAPREKICAKRHAFVKNKNLAILAEKMNLANYTINRDKTRGEKRTADMFEALIGAIFLDGKEDGIDNVYKFLDDNFRDDILNI